MQIALPRVSSKSAGIPLIAVPLAISLLAIAIRIFVGPLTIDDAYITFRYAKNIAEGVGFVYNSGEHVLGTTTPLWTLILASLYKVGLTDLSLVALVIGAFLDGLSTLLLLPLSRVLGIRGAWVLLPSALFSLAATSIAYTASGMETPLFICLILLAIWLDINNRPGWAGLAVGFATLTRPEGLLLAGLLIGRHLLLRKGICWRQIVGFVAPVLPWLCFATALFGSPLPQSVAAKASAYHDGASLAISNALLVFAQLGQPGFNLAEAGATPPPPLVGLVVGLEVAAVGVFALRRKIPTLAHSSELWALCGFAPLLAAAYVLAGLRSVPVFSWYLAPLVPFQLLGLVWLLQMITINRTKLLQGAVVAVIAGWTLLGFNLGRNPELGVFQPTGPSLVREQAYLTAASYLDVQADSVVALPEIGMFGYSSKARVLDTVGLVSPIASQYYPLPFPYPTNNAIPPDLIRDARPDYMVALDVFLPPALIEAHWFRDEYSLIRTFDAQIWGAKEVQVFARWDKR